MGITVVLSTSVMVKLKFHVYEILRAVPGTFCHTGVSGGSSGSLLNPELISSISTRGIMVNKRVS